MLAALTSVMRGTAMAVLKHQSALTSYHPSQDVLLVLHSGLLFLSFGEVYHSCRHPFRVKRLVLLLSVSQFTNQLYSTDRWGLESQIGGSLDFDSLYQNESALRKICWWCVCSILNSLPNEILGNTGHWNSDWLPWKAQLPRLIRLWFVTCHAVCTWARGPD